MDTCHQVCFNVLAAGGPTYTVWDIFILSYSHSIKLAFISIKHIIEIFITPFFNYKVYFMLDFCWDIIFLSISSSCFSTCLMFRGTRWWVCIMIHSLQNNKYQLTCVNNARTYDNYDLGVWYFLLLNNPSCNIANIEGCIVQPSYHGPRRRAVHQVNLDKYNIYPNILILGSFYYT